MEDLLSEFLNSSNETLTAAIVVISASLLLYNLTRNLRNRVARTSAAVLASVTITYICDVLIALGPGPITHTSILRLQWLGIAFMPAALFHLSDALLATTGLQSRGRRRRVARLLYLISLAFFVAAASTDILVEPVYSTRPVSLQPNWMFWLYLLFFFIVVGVAFINVQRAKERCLTRNTQRRMAYLQIGMVMPPLGIFPYSLLFSIRDQSSLWVLLLVNVSNVIIILMLLFLAYPLSFFGSQVPDRVVKADLMRFMLRGPATGLVVLVTIIFITPATRILSFPAGSFLPFAVVAVVLLWQWTVALILPSLEKRLIYFDEDDDQLAKLQNLSDSLLTRADLMQLIEATLAAICNYVRVSTAFLVSSADDSPELVYVVGPNNRTTEILAQGSGNLEELTQIRSDDQFSIHEWNGFWIMPLYSKRLNDDKPTGFIGIEARAESIDFAEEELRVLETYVRRAARTLDDILLQQEISGALEGLLPQYSMTRTRATDIEYKPGRGALPASNGSPDREQIIEQVRAALKHYWGGTGLTNSRLQELKLVRNAMEQDGDNNPVKTLRAMLLKAIEKQKPDGQRKMTSPEWTIYNILQLRYIEQVKVREVANRLALSEPDLYRKQRVAIEAVADCLIDMEREIAHNGS